MRRFCRLHLQQVFGVLLVTAFCGLTLYVLSRRRGLEKKWPRRRDVLRDLAEDEDVVQLKASASAGGSRKSSVNASLYEPYLFIAVKSGPARRDKRDQMRRMWMNDCRSGEASHAANKKKSFISCMFVVGRANDESLNSDLENEYHEHGDMILAPLAEGYGRMTAKTLWIMMHFYTTEQHHYLMMTEDDVVIILRTVLSWIGGQARRHFYAGHYHPAPVVYRCTEQNKADPNCVSKEAFSKDLYPRFAGSFAYVLSRDSVLVAMKTALGRISYPGLPGNVESAMVGVLLDDNGIALADVKGFIDYRVEMCPEISGQVSEIMVVGNAPTDIMEKLASNVRTSKPLCEGVRAHTWQ